MKLNRGHVLAALAGTGALLVAGLLVLERREIAVRYHIWHLEQAEGLDEAWPWLHALALRLTDLLSPIRHHDYPRAPSPCPPLSPR